MVLIDAGQLLGHLNLLLDSCHFNEKSQLFQKNFDLVYRKAYQHVDPTTLKASLRAEHDLEMASPMGLKLAMIAFVGASIVHCCPSTIRHLSAKSRVSARNADARPWSRTKEENSAESSSVGRTRIRRHPNCCWIHAHTPSSQTNNCDCVSKSSQIFRSCWRTWTYPD